MSDLSRETALPDIDRLFELQRGHRLRMAATTPAERRAILERFAGGVQRRRPQLIDALAADLGKSETEAEVTEVHQVLGALGLAAGQVGRWMAPRSFLPQPSLPALAQVVPEPKGTVLIIGPWNYPVTNLLNPCVDALAAGNTVILKPSEKAPATAAAVRALIEDVFEPRLVAVVEGGAEVSAYLTRLPFDHILFTGSTGVGRKVAQAAAENLTPVTLELGGKSPVLVTETADLAQVAERVAWGKLMNAGQTCIAPDYVLVPREHEAELVRQLRGQMERMYGSGEWLRGNTDLGRLVDAASVERLREALQGSVQQGAQVAFGGECDPAARYFAPTVVTGVTGEMPLMAEELFGPVLPVLTYDTLDAALDFIRRRPDPLALYAFTGHDAETRRIRAETRSGGLTVNGTMLHITDPRLPFGGRGHSGMGMYHGEYGFRTFSHLRTVVREPGLSATVLMRPPFDRPWPRMARWVLRLSEPRG